MQEVLARNHTSAEDDLCVEQIGIREYSSGFFPRCGSRVQISSRPPFNSLSINE
jgi:hypothetical protein